MWCELETWMLRLYRRQMWELMGDQPLDASNVQNMVDHMNSQAIFWKHIIIWCCTSQINCLTKENNSEQCSFDFATSYHHHNLQDCVSFFLDTSLLVNTIEKKKNLWQVIQWRAMASVTGRLYLVTAYLDERQGPMWEATHSYGLKLRKLQQTYSTNRKWLFLCVLCHVMCFIYITWHLVGIKWVH